MHRLAAAGAARSQDEATWLVHVRVDLYALIVRGDP